MPSVAMSETPCPSVCSSGRNPAASARVEVALKLGPIARSVAIIGWSCRFAPTPGSADTGALPSARRRRHRRSPTARGSPACRTTPAESTSVPARSSTGSPSRKASTRTPASVTSRRSTEVRSTMRKRSEPRTGSRYAKAVFHRVVPTTLTVSSPKESFASRSQRSEAIFQPSASAATRQCSWNGTASLRSYARTRIRSTTRAKIGSTSLPDQPGRPQAS